MIKVSDGEGSIFCRAIYAGFVKSPSAALRANGLVKDERDGPVLGATSKTSS
jgi:hypothetical protein